MADGASSLKETWSSAAPWYLAHTEITLAAFTQGLLRHPHASNTLLQSTT
jgi:hypothetical protein